MTAAARPKVFILLGMPGVGKGTQAKFIAETFRLLHIDTGAALRQEIASASELGVTAKGYVDQGQLVPFSLVMQIIKAAMTRMGSDLNGYLFDGFPRNLEQANGLNEILTELSLNLDGVLYLETPHEVLMDRLAYRVTCGTCDTKYNLKLNPPPASGNCGVCGGELVTRKDDHPDVIENRLKAYEAETEPLVGYYAERELLHRLDANQPIETVTTVIRDVVGPFFQPSDKVAV